MHVDGSSTREHSSGGATNELLDSRGEGRIEGTFAEMLEARRARRVAAERVVHARGDEQLGAGPRGERARLVFAHDPVVLSLDDEERAPQATVRLLDTCILQLTVERAAPSEEDLVRCGARDRLGLGGDLAIDRFGLRPAQRELAPRRRGHAVGPADARRTEDDRCSRR